MADASLLVIVPTYNERQNLPVLVTGLMRCPGARVLVVDDHSPDGTGEVAEALSRAYQGRVSVVHRKGPRGFGRSYLDGFAIGLQTGADLVCQMDADLSHDPLALPSLIAASAHADVVIGSRYVAGGRVVNWPLRRRLLSRSANVYIRRIAGLAVHDCTSGFRCWRRSALMSIPFDRIVSDGYSFLVEMLSLAASQGCRVAEVPITFVERRQGESKVSSRVLLESAIMPWRIAAARNRGSLAAPATESPVVQLKRDETSAPATG